MEIQNSKSKTSSLSALLKLPAEGRSTETIKATYLLPVETHRRLKKYSADRGLSMSAVIAELIENNC